MATSREERMASRLRGAGRHQVEDISFNFVLPEAEPSILAPSADAEPPAASATAPPPRPPPTPPPRPAKAPAPRSANPNTSAKRRRIAPDEPSREPIAAARTPAVAPLAPPPTATRSGRGRGTSASAARPDPYDLPDHSTEDSRSRPSPAPSTTRSGLRPTADALRRSVIGSRTPGAEAADEDELESLPRPTPLAVMMRAAATRQQEEVIDVVQESPADAPGSGRRRRVVRVSEVATSSSAVLQRVMQQQSQSRQRRTPRKGEVEGEEDEIAAEVDVSVSPGLPVGSSPLARKVAKRDMDRKKEKKTAEKKAVDGARSVEKDAVGPKGRESAPRRTARRSGVGAAAFGLDEVDELSPAPAVAASPAAAGKRSVRLSGGTADDGVDELSPAVARHTRRTTRPLREQATDKVDAPSSMPARSTRRIPGPVVETGADELDEPSPAHARAARRSVRVSDGSVVLGEADELSPEQTREVMGPPQAKKKPQKEARKPRTPQKENLKTKQSTKQPEETTAKSPPRSRRTQNPKPKAIPTEVPTVEEPEEAEEINEAEAALRLGRKRPRRSIQAPAEDDDLEQQEEEEPAAKRRRRKPPQSPATQQPPKTRKEKRQVPAVQPKSKKPPAKRKSKAAGPAGDADELEGGEDNGFTFPITVQRFTKKVRHDGSDGEADILGSDTIPFASRAGVNAVDVLAQMCDEMVGSFLSSLREQGRTAADAAARREVKTRMRALEAFREELRTRLLEHTIALDTLHSLRKRVRAAQKEKIALREEILRIRREREVVELRKDAVRVRHEREREFAMQNINLSSAMHDIDLAVEKGMAAEPLSAADQSKANLANLEFLITKVADLACSKSSQGGTLKQIKDFNAFLERAAAALEGR